MEVLETHMLLGSQFISVKIRVSIMVKVLFFIIACYYSGTSI